MSGATDAEITVGMTLTLDTVIGSTYSRGFRYDCNGDPEELYTEVPYTFLDAVIDRAAAQVVVKLLEDSKRYTSLRGRIFDRMTEAIDARITPLIDEAFSKPIVKTNTFGEPKGETTLNELVIAEVRRLLNQGSGSYDKSMLSKALAQCTEQVMAKELANEMAAAKEAIREAIGKVTGKALATAIAREVGV